MARRRKLKRTLLRRLLKNPRSAVRSIRDERFCVEFLDYCDAEVVSKPARGKYLAGIAVRLATAIGNRCLRSRAFGVLLSAHRALGRYQFAERTAEVAFSIAPDCIDCRCDLWFRLAHLRSEQGFIDAALTEINKVLRVCADRRDKNGEGRAYFLRGVIYDRAGNRTFAKTDLSKALTLISPDRSPQYHSAALNSLVIVLSSGSAEEFRVALKLFPSVLKLYKGKRGLTAERAKLKWVRLFLIRRFTSVCRCHVGHLLVSHLTSLR